MSIRIGNTVLSYRRWEPFSTVLASIADLSREIEREGGVKPAVFSKWLMGFKDQAKDKTFLQGVSGLIQSIEDPDRFFERTAANIITGYVPNIIRQPIRALDNNIRDTSPRGDQGIFEAIARRVGYSIIPQAAPIKQDVWGNDVPTRRGDPLAPPVIDEAIRILDPSRTMRNPKADPIDVWIHNWNLRTADSSERISIQPISHTITGKLPNEKSPRRFYLSPEEQTEANRNAGRLAREMLGEGWEKKPLALDFAEQIKETVSRAQNVERARLRQKKLLEVMNAE